MNKATQSKLSPYRPDQRLAGRFRLVRAIGKGGLGHVWLAADEHLDNEAIALKLLRVELVNDARAIADLKREVLLTRRLRHPNILAIHTFWETRGARFITMEYIDGLNLGELMHRSGQPLPWARLAPWMTQVANALDFAHLRGVLHRDIKPANILLEPNDEVRLADFGIARTARELQMRLGGEQTSGTLHYMSPEQLTAQSVDHRSDQYSFAATLYDLLAGHPPFIEGDLVTRIQFEGPPLIPHLSPAMNKVLTRGLHKNAEKRYRNCVALITALGHASTKQDSPPFASLQVQPPVVAPRNHDTIVLERQDTAAFQRRLGAILLQEKRITLEDLDAALQAKAQAPDDARLGEILVARGVLREEDIAESLSRQLSLPSLIEELPAPDPALLDRITPGLAESRGCLPLRLENGALVVAMTDPLDLATINDLETTYHVPIAPCVTTPTALKRAIAKAFN